MLLIATVHYDIFCNEMIFSVLCINSQPSSDVINVYIDAQNDDFNGKCKYNKGYQSTCLYSFLLSTELKRDEESFVIPCVICDTM